MLKINPYVNHRKIPAYAHKVVDHYLIDRAINEWLIDFFLHDASKKSFRLRYHQEKQRTTRVSSFSAEPRFVVVQSTKTLGRERRKAKRSLQKKI